jgi:hypothetical protein
MLPFDGAPRSSGHIGDLKDKLTPDLRAFQLRRDVFRNLGEEALKTILESALTHQHSTPQEER